MKRIKLVAAVAITGAALTAPANTIPGNGGAWFITDVTGTLPNTFLEVETPTPAGSQSYSEGMNSGTHDVQYLNSKKGQYLPISSLGSIDGTGFSGVTKGNYIQLYLGVNQTANDPLALTRLSLFVSPNQIPDSGLAALRTTTPAWDYSGAPLAISPGGNGNSDYDMIALIPLSLTGRQGYLYLYSQFGPPATQAPVPPDDGSEKWGAYYGEKLPDDPSVPDASMTLGLLGMAVAAVETFRRKLIS